MVETAFAAAALRGAPSTLAIGLHAVFEPGTDAAAAEVALRRQLARFVALRGARPSHLDSHKHAHAAPGPFAAVLRVAAEQRLPVRALDAGMRSALRAAGLQTTDAFLGDAGQRPAWSEEALLKALARVGEGTTELMSHPGYRPSQARTSFGAEREVELAALCSVAARDLVRSTGLHLCSYLDLAG
jgi:predicted glycoside hydrolase/deacetylase ChbG (UPF0249 family)